MLLWEPTAAILTIYTVCDSVLLSLWRIDAVCTDTLLILLLLLLPLLLVTATAGIEVLGSTSGLAGV